MNNKRKFSQFLIGILIFVIGSLIVSFIFYPDTFQSLRSNVKNFITGLSVNFIPEIASNFVPIQDLNQNPESYVGKNISTKGMLNNRLGGYSLEDDKGYWVWVGINEFGSGCIENQREYNYNSEIYSVQGTFLSPQNCELSEYGLSCFGIDYEYRIQCLSPLN